MVAKAVIMAAESVARKSDNTGHRAKSQPVGASSSPTADARSATRHGCHRA